MGTEWIQRGPPGVGGSQYGTLGVRWLRGRTRPVAGLGYALARPGVRPAMRHSAGLHGAHQGPQRSGRAGPSRDWPR
jgi:hypothetical protein